LVNAYFLDFPNLEVKVGTIPLLLSLEPLKDPLEAKQQCDSVLNSIIKLDAIGFQEYFGYFLSSIPYNLHEDHESYYHTMF
jgi:hypothetical protein